MTGVDGLSLVTILAVAVLLAFMAAELGERR